MITADKNIINHNNQCHQRSIKNITNKKNRTQMIMITADKNITNHNNQCHQRSIKKEQRKK
jgi:hypothetical protein